MLGPLLPTPTVNDSKGGRNATAHRSQGDESQHHSGTTLTDVAYAETFGDYSAAVSRQAELYGPPPEPTEVGPKGNRRLNPAFVEWMMGLPAGHVTSHITTRTHALRLLGNGVVPPQAALALHVLSNMGHD